MSQFEQKSSTGKFLWEFITLYYIFSYIVPNGYIRSWRVGQPSSSPACNTNTCNLTESHGFRPTVEPHQYRIVASSEVRVSTFFGSQKKLVDFSPKPALLACLGTVFPMPDLRLIFSLLFVTFCQNSVGIGSSVLVPRQVDTPAEKSLSYSFKSVRQNPIKIPVCPAEDFLLTRPD